MVEVTKEQIQEVLTRLQDYSRWMYYSPVGIKKFENVCVSHNGITYSLGISGDNYILADDLGNSALIACAVGTTKPIQGIENMTFRAKIVNAAELGPEVLARFDEVRIFALSAFQRSLAFTFFARMAPVTLEEIAGALDLAREVACE